MVLFAEMPLPAMLCLVAVAITVCFLLMRSQRGFSRVSRDSAPLVPTSRPEREKPGYHADAPNDMLRWDVAMHETARDLSAQLDSKLGMLQHLIREADRAAARLEAALQASADLPGRDNSENAGALPVVAPESRTVSQAEALRSTGTGGVPEGDSASNVRYQEIYLLADYGYPSAEIAHRLGSPVGEIELILSLRSKR